MTNYVIGEKKVVNGETRYYPAGTQQGYVYKDSSAFENGEGICYIPEYGFEIDDKSVEYLTQEQAESNGVTREDIERECEEILGDKSHAQDIFDMVDWQHTCTLAQEYEEGLE